MYYKWKIDKDVSIPYPDKLFEFKNEWVEIKDGIMTIKAEYAWNGCSPAVSIGGLFTLNTPNGIIDYRTGKPLTYYASLYHDVLCQWCIGDKKNADGLFLKYTPKEFKIRLIYYFWIRTIGTIIWHCKRIYKGL